MRTYKRDKRGRFANKHTLKQKIRLGPKQPVIVGGWDQIKGSNAKLAGRRLFEAKVSGSIRSDSDYRALAREIGLKHRAAHPGDRNAATTGAILRAAYRHEYEATGKIGSYDTSIPVHMGRNLAIANIVDRTVSGMAIVTLPPKVYEL